MIINSGKGMRFYQAGGAGGGGGRGGGAVSILVDISAKLDKLNDVIKGLKDLEAATVKVSTSSAASIGAFGSPPNGGPTRKPFAW